MKRTCLLVLLCCSYVSASEATILYNVLDLSAPVAVGSTRPGPSEWSHAQALDINDDWVIVGEWQDNAFAFDLRTYAFIGSEHVGPNSSISRFTTTRESYATGINNRGQIVGYANHLPDNTPNHHNYVYDYTTDVYTVVLQGEIDPNLDLDHCENCALDITDDGEFAHRQPYTGPSAAELISSIDPSLSYRYLQLNAINSDGIIVASGWNPSETWNPRALVFIPVSVPEPATLLLLGLGLVGVRMARRR